MVERTRTFAFEVTASTCAPAPKLFSLVSDGARWSSWAGPLVPHSRMERLGDPAPGGVGAVRLLGRAPVFLREETVEFEQDRRHAYVLRTPAPVRDYRGEVTLVPRDGGGTDLVWRCSFVERLPGTGPVIHAGLRALIRALTTRLVQAAER